MNRTLDYKCPVDIRDMSGTNGQIYCTQCNKHIIDLKTKSDIEVLHELNKLKGPNCISIETDRLRLVTNKISSWKLLLLIILNFKAFFLRKLIAQIPQQDKISNPKSEPILRILNGSIVDIKTDKPVEFPTIEVYKSNILLQTIKGDKKGNFILHVRGPESYADTITLRVYSEFYSGSLVNKIQIRKKLSEIKIKIPKEGIRPSPPEINDASGSFWTGRVLD